MLEAAMAFALHQKASLLSIWPRQVTHSLGEKCVNTLLYLLGIGFFPHLLFWAAQRSEHVAALIPNALFQRIGGANGQLLLFTRDAYVVIGGHAAVRAHLVEDVALARRIAARIPAGYRLINADGTLLVRCRMYESFAEVWEGFTKNGRAVFEESIFLFLVFGTILFTAFFLPFVLLIALQTGRAATVAEVLAIYGLRMLYAARYRSSWLGAALHPIGLMFAMLIGLNSWRRSAGSVGVRWKGRTYKVAHSSST